MLSIDPASLIGKGLHREVFVHPADDALCVKIVVAGDSDENQREAKYYQRLSRRGISWDMLARFHGLLETNMGVGAVFDLIRDWNGEVSRPLDYYLEQPLLAARFSESIAARLRDLKGYLLENYIVTMTLKPKNILFQRSGESDGKLVIVDNVGNTDFLPLSNYSAFFARRKIERKWLRFEKIIAGYYGRSRPVLG